MRVEKHCGMCGLLITGAIMRINGTPHHALCATILDLNAQTARADDLETKNAALKRDKAALLEALRGLSAAANAIDMEDRPEDWGRLGTAIGNADNLLARENEQ